MTKQATGPNIHVVQKCYAFTLYPWFGIKKALVFLTNVGCVYCFIHVPTVICFLVHCKSPSVSIMNKFWFSDFYLIESSQLHDEHVLESIVAISSMVKLTALKSLPLDSMTSQWGATLMQAIWLNMI